MEERHGKLYSSFVQPEKLRNLGMQSGEEFSRKTRKSILEEESRVERWYNEYDSCWTEIDWSRAQSLFESSKSVKDKKESIRRHL
jgi:hypothetical protein